MTIHPADSVLFSGIAETEARLIEQAGSRQHVDQGAILFLQNDPGDHFFLVLSGKIKIYKNSPDGKEQILLMAAPGDTFGEAALFAEKTYPANAEAIETSELLAFSRDTFLDLIGRHPTLAVNMIARLSMLLHHLTRLVQHLSLEDISTRLAVYITDRLPAEAVTGAVTITLDEKKMTLAAMLGTIPETLSRVFARLSKAGLLSVEGQEITIHSPERLRDLADGRKG